MKLKPTPKFIIAFLALAFLMHEAHEIVHTTVARLICGCWGQRDFNVWGICEGCAEQHPIVIVSTFAGPIFTFMMIWTGASFIGKNKSDRQQSLGFALIFANMPFARILTASMGGGDEVWGLNLLIKNHSLAWAIGLTAILLVSSIPIYKAYKLIGNRVRMGWFLLFFLAPVAIDLLVVLGLMNTLLEKGVLNTYWILGSPILVTVWTASVALLFLLTRKHIYTLSNRGKLTEGIADIRFAL